MRSFIEQAKFYAAYHQKPLTRYAHFIGVPLIIFSVMVFFGFLHLIIPGVMDITLAGLTTFTLLGYYYYLNWRLALALTIIFIVLLWFADLVSRNGPNSTSLWIFLITFVLGWLFQFAGHFFEGKRPAFMDNMWQSLIAPLYLTAQLFFLAGYMLDLQKEIETATGEGSVEIEVEK